MKKVAVMTIWLLLPVLGACNGDDDTPDWTEWEGECVGESSLHIETGTTWQWQLTGTLDTGLDVELYDIDLFDTSQGAIDSLHGQGKVVICYFSAGTWEEWREDADLFPEEALGNTMEEWEDEKWVDVRNEEIREIMLMRLDLAVEKGCDGVEPDNVDGYLGDNHSGFDFDGFDQLDYNQFLAEEAHARGLTVGLKNDVDQIEPLEPCFDWALNEECLSYDECDKYAPFLDAGKAVFHVEYVDLIDLGPDLAEEVCGDESIEGFSTLIKEWDLSEWVIEC